MTLQGRTRRQATTEGARPRYLRIATAGLSALVTVVAVLGAGNVLPVDASQQSGLGGSVRTPADAAAQSGPAIALSGSAFTRLPLPHPPSDRTGRRTGDRGPGARPAVAPGLPARSGQGRRIVFDIGDQRVWLVSAKGEVRRSYLVSGSLTDNLGPGSYEVYSRSRHAVGIDDSGTMEYMVRFTQGENAAIGFHDIPVHQGEKVQTARQLGTPQSHGCIRQLPKDAKALWDFAPVGTTVVVTA